MQAADLARYFQKKFDSKPKVFSAPGRVNLIGEHTDYNDGFVLPSAIDFYTQVAIAPRNDHNLIFHSENFPQEYEFDTNRLPSQRLGAWCDYVLGVAMVLRGSGIPIGGANLLVKSDVPIGAGLSSSAAIEVASAL